MENSEAEILANGLVRLERRRKIENVNEVTFLALVCLSLFDQKGDSSLSRMVRSEMVGLDQFDPTPRWLGQFEGDG